MVSNLKYRGCALIGIDASPDLDSQVHIVAIATTYVMVLIIRNRGSQKMGGVKVGHSICHKYIHCYRNVT